MTNSQLLLFSQSVQGSLTLQEKQSGMHGMQGKVRNMKPLKTNLSNVTFFVVTNYFLLCVCFLIDRSVQRGSNGQICCFGGGTQGEMRNLESVFHHCVHSDG